MNMNKWLESGGESLTRKMGIKLFVWQALATISGVIIGIWIAKSLGL